MEEYGHLRVFSKDMFEEIKVVEQKVPVIGEILLSKDEENLLKRSPKFALMPTLNEDTMREDMEKAYSLVRIELRDEEDAEQSKDEAEIEKAEIEKEKSDEEAAKCRQVFDPINNTFDQRKRRVTDLVECSRVVLPKPLGVNREAQIENRRQVHEKIYQDYRKEFCKKNGDQVENLTASEKKGLESLKKRIKKEEILVIKTDKSGKLSVTNREKYLEMGKEHVGDDKEVGRDEIKDTDRIMNEHSAAWCSIWRTGKDHSQEDRVRQSKVSKSENRAKLYLAHKDHKKEKEKTRPIGTANSSNTRAFANSVSELLEAVANSEDNKFEVISSEDMLYSVRASNLKVEDLRRTRPLKVQLKRRCWGCKVWKIGCSAHKEDDKGGKKSLEEEKEVESKLVRRRKSFPSLSLNLKAEKNEKIQKKSKK